MGRKSAFNAETAIKAVNNFRVKKNGESFSKNELIAVFKENGIPTNHEFWGEFVKSGIVKRIYDDQYEFTSNTPVYYLALDKVYREYRAKTRKYKENWTSKKEQKNTAQKEETAEPDEISEESSEEILEAFEEIAVAFLKELGYKIFKPVATVYENV